MKRRISNLVSLAESCLRQLRAGADHLQNCEIKGQRHLTEKTRRLADQKRRANEFQGKLTEIVRKSRKSQI